MFARLTILLCFLCAGMAQGELRWENPAQEFVRRPEDRELTVNFSFRNTGDTPVTIVRIRPSCGCTTAELAQRTYQPGETGRLTARFGFGFRRGLQTKTITVETNDQQRKILGFKCLIAADAVTLSPSFVFWRLGEAPEAKQVQVDVAQNPPVRVVSVASSNPHLIATLTTQKPGAKYGISVRPTDTARPESGEVSVQTDYPPEGPKIYTIHVRVK